jgi:glycosyltransferase involved in cell wall biosynthesis
MTTDTDYRCVHVIGALAAGGAERFVVDLVRQLSKMGRRVELVVLSRRRDEAGGEMAKSLASDGVPIEVGPTVRVRFRTMAWYARTIRARRDAIVHLHTTNTELVHYLTRPIVGDVGGLVRTVHNTVLPDSGLSGFAFRHLPAQVSIACGSSAMERHRDHLRGQLLAIPNGVRFDWPIRSVELAEEARVELGLEPGLRHAVCVGRMFGESTREAQKGHDLLIEAWRRSDAHRHARLHLLGDGPLRGTLERMAAGDSSIRFHGVRSDVSRWLTAADLFVMPSRWEGLPIAAIEAIGAGIPCLFSSIEPLRELGGPAVSISEVGDVDDLASRIRLLVEAPSFPALESVREFRRRYGIERAASEYDGVYRSLVASECGAAPASIGSGSSSHP